MARITLQGYKCERCSHTWVPRQGSRGEPKVCPKCKSPYWNTPRRGEPGKAARIKKGTKRPT